jgi:FkbM family methyltransferase
MKGLFSILRFIWGHPLASTNRFSAFKRFFSWQISQRIINEPVLYPFIENSVLLIKKGMAGATGNVYTGLLDFEDMAFVLHVLREGDLFADIGANVGVFTILAAKNAGAKVLSVEPIPSTFSSLKKNVILNEANDLVTLMPCGVGSQKGTLKFTRERDAVNHVIGNDELVEVDEIIEIPVDTLDDIFWQDTPLIMKIDVEGFEWPALVGSEQLLKSPNLKGVIIELNGSGGRYGYSDDQIEDLLVANGFRAFKYDPFLRKLSPLDSKGNVNTIYLRDIDWINSRTSTSRKYKVMGQDV